MRSAPIRRELTTLTGGRLRPLRGVPLSQTGAKAVSQVRFLLADGTGLGSRWWCSTFPHCPQLGAAPACMPSSSHHSALVANQSPRLLLPMEATRSSLQGTGFGIHSGFAVTSARRWLRKPVYEYSA